MILAKVTDDLLFAFDMNNMKEFSDKLRKIIKVSKTLIDQPIYFNGCRIVQDDDGNLTMDMDRYVKRINCMEIKRRRGK